MEWHHGFFTDSLASVCRALSMLASGAIGQMQYHVLTNTAEELEYPCVCIVRQRNLGRHGDRVMVCGIVWIHLDIQPIQEVIRPLSIPKYLSDLSSVYIVLLISSVL
jgi:hypothetical protein